LYSRVFAKLGPSKKIPPAQSDKVSGGGEGKGFTKGATTARDRSRRAQRRIDGKNVSTKVSRANNADLVKKEKRLSSFGVK